MAEKIEVGVTIKGSEKVSSDLNKIDSKTQGISGSVDMASGSLDRMTGGMVTMFKGVASGVKKAVLGMRTLKGAMMATGIGALVVVVGSLVAFFTKTQKGAEMLEVASASLGVIMGKLTDTLSYLGGIMVSAFQNPQEAIASLTGMLEDVWGWFSSIGSYIKESFILNILVLQRSLKKAAIAAKEFFGGDASEMREELAEIESAIESTLEELEKAAEEVTGPLVKMYGAVVDGIKELVDETIKAVSAQNALTKASQRLRQAERDLIIDQAKKLAIIAEQEVISKDITKTFEERLAANKLAQESEASIHAQRVANAKEKLRIHQEEMGLTESLEEDYKREADLIAAVINLNTQSARLKKKFVVEEGMLNTQQAAADKLLDDAEIKRKDTLRKATQTAQQNEVDALNLKYLTLNEMAMGNAETEKLLKDKKEADLLAITEKYTSKELEVVNKAAQDKKAIEQATADAIKTARLGLVSSGFAALNAMAKTEEQSKKLAIAQILVNQAIAMSQAIAGATTSATATGPGAFVATPLFIAQALGIVLGSFASIKGVLNQAGAATDGLDTDMPDLSGGSGGGGGGNTSGSGNQLALTPDMTGSFLGNSIVPPVQAYIIQNDIADAGALQTELQTQASL
tara:strand:- start:15 stop:1907 length:1893 start_codon:yes stop_codon:yes gene_type:complete